MVFVQIPSKMENISPCVKLEQSLYILIGFPRLRLKQHLVSTAQIIKLLVSFVIITIT